jgi:hypothetical protein
MSIIHDALKKVQQTNNPGSVPPPAPLQEPGQRPDPKNVSNKTNIILLITTICAIVVMIFAALPQFTPKKTVPTPTPATQITQEKQTAAAPAAITAPVSATPAPEMPAKKTNDPKDPLSSMQIEGVMDMEGKKVVLINGNIYEEGQTIHGKIISKIAIDSLTVMEDGKERTFPIKP